MNATLQAELDRVAPANEDGLRFCDRVVTLMLPIGSPIMVSVKPTGIQDERYGDSVYSSATVWLPGPTMHKRLFFGDRVMLASEHLKENWGYISGDKRTHEGERYAGATWLASLRATEHAILHDLDRLWLALEAHQAALDSEGRHYFLATKLSQ